MKTNSELQNKNLTMLIKQLVAAIKKHDPGNKTASRAMRYLKDNGHIGDYDCLRSKDKCAK